MLLLNKTDNILQVKKLHKAFGKFVALNNIDFEIKAGRIVGLLGKNGAGKTTLIKSILGLYKDVDGEILYDGVPIATENAKIMGTIGALVDTKFHEDLSAYDNLMLLLMASNVSGARNRKDKIEEILSLVGLKENAKDKVKSFSMGMKQRLALAQALMTDAKLLILDEPFVGLDPVGIELIKEKLHYLCKEKKVSIIFSSHQLAEVGELSEDIIVINDGTISFMGTYESLVDDTKKYRIYLNRPIEIDVVKDMKAELSDNEKEIIIKKSDCILNSILLELLQKEFFITDISVEENALLQLFQK